MCWWFFKGDSISLNHCSNNTQGDDDIDCCGDYIETDCVSAASILSVLSARGMHTHETVNARDVFSDMNGGIDAEVSGQSFAVAWWDCSKPPLSMNNHISPKQSMLHPTKNCSRRSQCTWLWSSPYQTRFKQVNRCQTHKGSVWFLSPNWTTPSWELVYWIFSDILYTQRL